MEKLVILSPKDVEEILQKSTKLFSRVRMSPMIGAIEIRDF